MVRGGDGGRGVDGGGGGAGRCVVAVVGLATGTKQVSMRVEGRELASGHGQGHSSTRLLRRRL